MMTSRRALLRGLGALATGSLVPRILNAAQPDFPSRPVTLLVGLAPGGVTDLMARVYADAVSRLSGQSVVVENRPAASGAVAAAALQHATADGYTLLLFAIAQHATIPAMTAGATYDPIAGMQPVTELFNVATVFAVPAASPVHSFADLQALAQQKPGGLTFGSPGLGTPSHLLAANVMAAAGIRAEYAHYRGGAPMVTDLLSGRLDVAVLSTPLARPYLADRKLRGIALDAPERWSVIPDTPTLTDLGLADASVPGWFGIGAAPGTPPAIVERLNQLFVAASRDSAVEARIEANGLSVVTSTPEDMRNAMIAANTKIIAVVRKLGLGQK